MDLQTRKLNIIEYLIGIQDENIFRKIESSIFESNQKDGQKRVLKPFSQEEMIERVSKSNQEYVDGKFKSQDQLENESANW